MGYVYRYTHKQNGKWYVGSHNGNKKEYSGSGLLWARAKKKYGLESFTKEILYEGNDFRQKEQDILMSLDAANDAMSYNMKNEALGGAFFGEKNGMYGKHPSEETKYLNGTAFRGKKRPDHSIKMSGENNPAFGKNDHCHGLLKHSEKLKGTTFIEFYGEEKANAISKKISNANLGIKKPGTSEANKGAGNPSAKAIIFRGKEYGSISIAMDETGLSRYKIKKECEYIKKPTNTL